MRRLVATVAVLLIGVVSLGASGGDLPTKRIAITVTGESVTPNGQQYDVAIGQRVELDVTADKPGEIHVHSSPEQEFQYDAGSTTLSLKPIQRPGVVTVESHTLEKTILKLKVS
jgi:hypothetical protein